MCKWTNTRIRRQRIDVPSWHTRRDLCWKHRRPLLWSFGPDQNHCLPTICSQVASRSFVSHEPTNRCLQAIDQACELDVEFVAAYISCLTNGPVFEWAVDFSPVWVGREVRACAAATWQLTPYYTFQSIEETMDLRRHPGVRRRSRRRRSWEEHHLAAPSNGWYPFPFFSFDLHKARQWRGHYNGNTFWSFWFSRTICYGAYELGKSPYNVTWYRYQNIRSLMISRLWTNREETSSWTAIKIVHGLVILRT